MTTTTQIKTKQNNKGIESHTLCNARKLRMPRSQNEHNKTAKILNNEFERSGLASPLVLE
jgi:hypothetical protein